MLIARFNDKNSDLDILVLTFSILATGINLYQACSRAGRGPSTPARASNRTVTSPQHDDRVSRSGSRSLTAE